MDKNEEFNPDLITVVDDDGKDHTFEELDRIELDNGCRYVALTPAYPTDEEVLDSDGELIILKVEEENGETYLNPIEDENEFDEVAEIFEERLDELYEIIDDDE